MQVVNLDIAAGIELMERIRHEHSWTRRWSLPSLNGLGGSAAWASPSSIVIRIPVAHVESFGPTILVLGDCRADPLGEPDDDE